MKQDDAIHIVAINAALLRGLVVEDHATNRKKETAETAQNFYVARGAPRFQGNEDCDILWHRWIDRVIGLDKTAFHYLRYRAVDGNL